MTIDFESATVPVEHAQAEQASVPRKLKIFQLLDERDLDQLPAPTWLIENMIPEDSLAVLVGEPAVGKSFLAIDAALCVATGRPFLGRPVMTGQVVYVVGESARGFKKRLRAWTHERGLVAGANFFFLREPVQVLEPSHVLGLIELLKGRKIRPKLVVLDTLARCFNGGDENSSADMSKLVAAADEIRRATGATILFVHHPTKSGNQERGHSALRGAADTMLWLEKMNGGLVLECVKQKDDEPFGPVSVWLKPALDSCVVELAGSGVPAKRTSRAAGVKPEPCLDALKVVEGTAGATWSEWQSSCQIAESTFNHHLKRLLRNKLVVKDPGSKRYSTVKEPR
jgi:hypothetical protein